MPTDTLPKVRVWRPSWLTNSEQATKWLARADRSTRLRRFQAALAYPALVLDLAHGDPALTAAIDLGQSLESALSRSYFLPPAHIRRLRGIRFRYTRGDLFDALRFRPIAQTVFLSHLAAMPVNESEWSLFWRLRHQFEQLFRPPSAPHLWMPYRTFAGLRKQHEGNLADVLEGMLEAREMTRGSLRRLGHPDHPMRYATMGELHRLSMWQSLLRIGFMRKKTVVPQHLATCWRPWLLAPIEIRGLRIRELRNVNELSDAGNKLRNCALDFAYSCHNNSRRILIIEDSTGSPVTVAEVEPPGQWNQQQPSVRQHLGLRNTAPPSAARKALGQFMHQVQAEHIRTDPCGLEQIDPPDGMFDASLTRADATIDARVAIEIRKSPGRRWRV